MILKVGRRALLILYDYSFVSAEPEDAWWAHVDSSEIKEMAA